MDQETGRVSKTAWAPEIDVRIANPPTALLKKYRLKEKSFFYDYASFVVRLIRNEEVTDRIRGVISAERILIDRPVDIRVMVFPFFFQAEDGIRDVAVTGVQTCALPI